MTLIKACEKDLRLIHQMQIEAFQGHLDKYQDYDTNPGNEPYDKIKMRFDQRQTNYYLIKSDDKTIGAVRLVVDDAKESYRISPIFILPNHRGKGHARAAMLGLETLYSNYSHWQLSTIYEDKKLCNFYEALGYVQGNIEIIKEDMHLVYYDKVKEGS